MVNTNNDSEPLVGDETNRIDWDFHWAEDNGHSSVCHFRAPIESDAGYPLFVNSRCSVLAGMVPELVTKMYTFQNAKSQIQSASPTAKETSA